MDPRAILIMTCIAFVVGLVSWALPAWKYHKHTKVGTFAAVLLLAGIVFMSMFKWNDVALDLWGAKLQIKERDQKIALLQTTLLNAQTALAQAEEKAPDQTALASYIEAAMQKAGVTVDPNTVKGIAAESLKPLQTYFDSTEWSSIKPQNPSGSTTPGKLSPNYVPMVPNKTN